MKVALVNPPLEESRERQYARMKEPHLGLAYLAACLEEKDIAPVVIDAKFEGIGFSQVMERLKDENPDLIGLTAFTPEIEDAAHLATEVKRGLPQAVVVVGGAHVTALPRQSLEEFPCFDFVVYGEGEITLYQLALALEGKQAMKEVNGLAFREGGVQVNPPRPFLSRLDELPFPAWHLFPRSNQYPIETSRGCPFRCHFCCRITGNKIRLRPPQRVVEEMEEVYNRFHPRHFTFNDETFGVNHRHANELLNLMIERGIPSRVRWNITTRVDVVNLELMIKLKEAGCTSLGFGIESGNQQILDSVGKGITLEKAEQAVAMAKRAGLRTNSFFILGHPYETKQNIHETLDFAARLNTTRVNFGIMVPYPGTEIAHMVERGEGNYRLLSTKWSDYGKQVGNVLELTNLSRAELERLQLWGYIRFHLHNFSPAKLVRLIREAGFKAIGVYVASLLRRRLARSRP